VTPWLIVKPLPVLGLAVWVASAARGRAAWLVVAGLVLSLVADVLIEKSFLAGLAVFLLAHLAYVAAFVARDAAPRPLLLVPCAAWGVLMLWRLWPGVGALRVPVVVYSVVICAMMWRAAAASAGGSEWITLVGAVLFAASDSLLALDKFHRPLPGAGVMVMALYWAGQLFIAWSARSSAT
jgi:alkenylglycerophosphocholine hydrolase